MCTEGRGLGDAGLLLAWKVMSAIFSLTHQSVFSYFMAVRAFGNNFAADILQQGYSSKICEGPVS